MLFREPAVVVEKDVAEARFRTRSRDASADRMTTVGDDLL